MGLSENGRRETIAADPRGDPAELPASGKGLPCFATVAGAVAACEGFQAPAAARASMRIPLMGIIRDRQPGRP